MRHWVHGEESDWSNTNCYLDVWMNVLDSLGLDPIPAFASAISAEFVGDQWEFLKVRSEDLETLYGIRFGEYDTWRPLHEHLAGQLASGNLAIVEVDAFYLPDTVGVSYREEHTKTSIAPVLLDQDAHRLVYFHNGGLHELFKEDYDNTVGAASEQGFVPRPYVDLIRLDGLQRFDAGRFPAAAQQVLKAHLRRIGNSSQQHPMVQLTDYVLSQREVLAESGMAHFHQFSFATTRQAGLSAMFASEVAQWFADAETRPEVALPLGQAAQAFAEASSTAKRLQFQLARVAAGRRPDLQPTTEALNEAWDRGITLMKQWDAFDE